MKSIEIIVSPNGESCVETKGFAGDSCREASKYLEIALGKTATEKLKPEFHEQTSTQNSVENSN